MSDVYQDLESIERWLLEIDISCISTQSTNISKEEKKLLLATNKAIQQLEKLGVPIPDELQAQQLKLSILETPPIQASEQGVSLESIDSVVSSLHALLSKAKSIRLKLSARKRVNKTSFGPKQHFGVSLHDLLENGVINTEAKLELQWRRNGEIVEGKVLKNGHIEVHTNSGWKEYKSISTAATEIAGCALNGWKHWKIIDSDGNRASLESVRDRYLTRNRYEFTRQSMLTRSCFGRDSIGERSSAR